jgi:hypothetical protein
MVRGHWHQERVAGNDERGIQTLKSRMGDCDPCPQLIYVTLMGLVQGLEHVDMPLPKLMNPLGDQVRAVGVSDHGVKTTLERLHQ